MNDDRKVMIKKNGKWFDCEFRELKDGMLFKLFESDGTPVKDYSGKSEFLAICDAHENEEGIWMIKVHF